MIKSVIDVKEIFKRKEKLYKDLLKMSQTIVEKDENISKNNHSQHET